MQFTGFSELGQLPDSADKLFAHAASSSVFFSRAWLELLVNDARRRGQTTLLAGVVDAGELMALLPLVQVGQGAYRALGHTYSSLYTLLLAAQKQDAVLDCLVSGLLALPIYQLTLEPLDDQDPVVQALQQSLQAHGMQCSRGFRFHNWYEPIDDAGFNGYLARRPARLRNTIKRKRRKLEREQDMELQIVSGEQVKPVIAEFHRVYQASWKGRENYQQFVDELVTGLSQSAQLWLGLLRINGQPAAAQLWFVTNTHASIFKLAYDPAWAAYSPGSILTAFLFEQAIDQAGVEEVDFLYGDDAYKQDWMSHRRQRGILYCRLSSPVGGWQGLVSRLRRMLGVD